MYPKHVLLFPLYKNPDGSVKYESSNGVVAGLRLVFEPKELEDGKFQAGDIVLTIATNGKNVAIFKRPEEAPVDFRFLTESVEAYLIKELRS